MSIAPNMRRPFAVTALAGMAALAGWLGLALQLLLLVRNLGADAGTWRFLGFFTILTNIGAATVATAVAFGARSGVGSARARLLAATSIVMVGIVYSVALRALWHPTGLQKAADVLLHDAAPLAWAALWLAGPHVRRNWRNLSWALVPPVAYCLYAFLRGAADGWYAYWFLNPQTQSIGELAISVAILLVAFAALASLLIAVDRWLARPAKLRADDFGQVDEAGEESFPASDPPSWTLGTEPRE